MQTVHADVITVPELYLYILPDLFFSIVDRHDAGPGAVTGWRVAGDADHCYAGDGFQLVEHDWFLCSRLVTVGAEIDDGILFKSEIFIEGKADLFGHKQRGNDEDLGDDELGDGKRLPEPGGAAITGVGKSLVLEYEDGFEAGEDKGRVNT